MVLPDRDRYSSTIGMAPSVLSYGYGEQSHVPVLDRVAAQTVEDTRRLAGEHTRPALCCSSVARLGLLRLIRGSWSVEAARANVGMSDDLYIAWLARAANVV